MAGFEFDRSQYSESGLAMLADLRAAIEEMDEINRWAADDEMTEDNTFAADEDEAAVFTDPDDIAAQERMGATLRAALIKAIEQWDAGR